MNLVKTFTYVEYEGGLTDLEGNTGQMALSLSDDTWKLAGIDPEKAVAISIAPGGKGIILMPAECPTGDKS